MKFVVRAPIKGNLKVLMSRLGYHQRQDRRNGQLSYIRRLGGQLYPRFHIYINAADESYKFKLHLDEKRPSYSGQTRHSGQYSGDLVENEIKRIQSYIQLL